MKLKPKLKKVSLKLKSMVRKSQVMLDFKNCSMLRLKKTYKELILKIRLTLNGKCIKHFFINQTVLLENFLTNNSTNKNLDLENSKSRFFDVLLVYYYKFKLHKLHNSYKKIQDLKLSPELKFLYYIYFFFILFFDIFIKNIITDDCC